MSDKHMVETVFQGKSVKRSLLPNYSAREILLYAFCVVGVTDGSETIEELYQCLGKAYDEETSRIDNEIDDEYEEQVVSWTVVDLDDCNIYIDCHSNSAETNRSRPIIQRDTLLDIMIPRLDEDSISFWNRCQIGNYKGFRCPFDLIDLEAFLQYVEKLNGCEIAGGEPEPEQNDSDMELPAWIQLWEKKRAEIGMPERAEDYALGKYRFSIYELFLMGIAFEKDEETIAFVNLLNQTLKKDIDECVEGWEEEVTILYSVFKYNRDMTAQEKQELHKKSLDSMDTITRDLKNMAKRSILSWREKIPGIIRNDSMNALAERIDGVLGLRRNVQKELCIWTMGELEAADLSKSKNLSQEEIDGIQNGLMWYHARPYWDAHLEFDEAMKEWRKKQPIVLEKYTVEDLDLSVRAYNCLKRAKINSLADLANMSWEELTQIRNMGKNSAKEIREKVKEFGIHFGLDD